MGIGVLELNGHHMIADRKCSAVEADHGVHFRRGRNGDVHAVRDIVIEPIAVRGDVLPVHTCGQQRDDRRKQC
jgi:hypothetical protein